MLKKSEQGKIDQLKGAKLLRAAEANGDLRLTFDNGATLHIMGTDDGSAYVQFEIEYDYLVYTMRERNRMYVGYGTNGVLLLYTEAEKDKATRFRKEVAQDFVRQYTNLIPLTIIEASRS